MLTILFYLLRDDGKLRRWFYESIDHDDDIVSYTQAVDDDLETVFPSNLAVILVAATAAVVTYYGLNFVASGGTVGDAGVALPAHRDRDADPGRRDENRLRPLRVGSPRRRVALTTPKPLWHPIAFFALTFVVVDTIPDFFARSFLSARSGVHMGLVLLGYFLGTLAFGWWGCSSVRSSSSSRSTSGRRSSPDSRAIFPPGVTLPMTQRGLRYDRWFNDADCKTSLKTVRGERDDT